MSKTVAVALSGGIDSAVAAKILLEKGFNVVALTGKMTCDKDSEQIVLNAKRVADKLGIKHYVLDVSKEFNEKIIKYFETSYKNGKTPNPCILCNKYIKWGIIFEYAINELGADYIATGHYARLESKDGVYKLYPASDEHKDQLYFLFSLSQEQLAKTLFPLSDYRKTEVKSLAIQYDLPPKSSKESQDICFIKAPMTTKKYLNNKFISQAGEFVEKATGKVLGKHNGYWQYTIGQRKGIGIAAPEPLYVLEIDSNSNIVYVGYKKELSAEKISLDNIYWSYTIDKTEFEALVKVRYNMQAVKAKIKIAEMIEISFNTPISGIAPGQACVLYDINDGHLIGGGFI